MKLQIQYSFVFASLLNKPICTVRRVLARICNLSVQKSKFSAMYKEQTPANKDQEILNIVSPRNTFLAVFLGTNV